MKIRASQAYKIMTDPKSKADKEAGILSETASSYMEELWLYNNYKYKEAIHTDEILKGLLCEQDSMDLVQRVKGGEFRRKNLENYENEYVTGTPDIILKNCIEDIKTSYNIRTYMKAELSKAYYIQGQVYMWLTGRKSYELIYCLVPTPDEIILNEQKKAYYRFNCDEENSDYIAITEQIKHNNSIINQIDAKSRVKTFKFDYDEKVIEDIKERYAMCLKYYNNIQL